MIKIAVCNNNTNENIELRDTIRNHLLNNKIVVKMNTYETPEKMLEDEEIYDIYLVDDNDSIDNIKTLSVAIREKAPECHLAYMSDTTAHAHAAYKIHADAYLIKPIDFEDLKDVLAYLMKTIREEHVIIKTSNSEKKVKAIDLNYIHIVKRCLCYHMTDGTAFDGQVLRQAFDKAITPLQEHEMFLFVGPSMLLNVANIKEIEKDTVRFENGESTYYPERIEKELRRRWKVFHNAIN